MWRAASWSFCGGGGEGGFGASTTTSTSTQPTAAQTASRARALSSLAAALSSLARERSLAVLLTNQVTTRPVAAVDRRASNVALASMAPILLPPTSVLVPALGDSWGHVPTTRLMLSWSSSGSSDESYNNRRVAELVKSPSLPPGRAEFEVTGEGIRGARGGVGGGGLGGGGSKKRPAAGAAS